jgi:hypothetical protein
MQSLVEFLFHRCNYTQSPTNHRFYREQPKNHRACPPAPPFNRRFSRAAIGPYFNGASTSVCRPFRARRRWVGSQS